MKWLLVFWVVTGGGYDSALFMPSHSVRAEIEMPSQEVCLEVLKLNASSKCMAEVKPAVEKHTLGLIVGPPELGSERDWRGK